MNKKRVILIRLAEDPNPDRGFEPVSFHSSSDASGTGGLWVVSAAIADFRQKIRRSRCYPSMRCRERTPRKGDITDACF